MDFTEAYPDTISTTARAASVGDVDALQNLIDQGKAVDVKDNRGWISLHEAAHHGHVECLKLILQQDRELVDFRTFQEETALILACRSASISCVKQLLDSGADVNASTFEGFSPLWEVTVCKSLECVRTLVAAGANINGQIFTGDTALHHAVQHRQTAIVQHLLESGADITVKTENDITPLFLGAQFGRLECLKMLIEAAQRKGSSFLVDYINTPAFDKATPLYLAAQEGHADCVDLLLQIGADPHLYVQVDHNVGHYMYPLQAAISKNSIKCVELLLKVTDMKRFDWAMFQTVEDMKRLDLALFGTKTNVIDALDRPPSPSVQPLFLAMDHEEPDCLRLLISHGYLKMYQKAVDSHKVRNIFQQVPLKIKPVVTFVKCCGRWMYPLYERNMWILASTAFFETPHHVTLQLLVILLRTGALSWCLLHRTRVLTMDDTQRLVLLCKYLKSDKLCPDCERMKRPNCIENLHVLGSTDFEKIDLNLILKLCLTPNFMRVVGRLEPLLSQPGSGKGKGNKKKRDVNTTLLKMKKTVIGCRESFNTLQHMCRVNIVYQLLYRNNYTREATLTLGLPVHLQRYLLFDDTGTPGEILVQAANGMSDLEATVDKLFEETDVSDLLHAVAND